MSFFDLDPIASANIMDRARKSPVNPNDLSPSWYSGALKAPITGLASVVNDAALVVGDVATPYARAVARPIDELFKTKIEDWLVSENQKAVDNIKNWAPDPRTTGVVGQMVHGLFNIIPEVIVGGPGSAALLQGYKGFRGGGADGLDQGTAFGKGVIDGVSTFVGLKVPMSMGSGFGAVKNIAFGAAVNTPVGMASRGAVGALLESRGYSEMAEQYQVLDKNAIATDLVMGGAFGALGHYGQGAMSRYQKWKEGSKEKILPSDIDTALMLSNQHHIDIDTAPGIPADMVSRGVHVETVNRAIESLLKDEPVIAEPAVTNAEFIENPSATAARESIKFAVDEHMGSDWKVFEEQLKERGLSLDDVDNSGAYRAIEQPTNQTQIKIEGQYYPAEWRVVDAEQVFATLEKSDNQFRDRTRAASESQISKISADPDFNLLSESPIMDFGAPTMTNKGDIVGGNGRFAGVSKSYEAGKSSNYQKNLSDNIQRFGIEASELQGKKRPVLVRVLRDDIDVKRAAIASNEGAGIRMSALEQAKVDAHRLGDIEGLQVSDTGELNTAGNRSYIQRWASQFPATEVAALVDKSGQLSAEGATRLRNAVLFRAYGDSPTLARLVESTDPGARNVANALLKTSPLVAEIKAAIESKSIYPLDISKEITEAVEILDNLRRSGTKVSEFLAQGEMFGAALSKEARVILQFFSENIRSAKAMSEMISGYYNRVRGEGNPSQSNMFDLEPQTKQDLLSAAIKDKGKDFGQKDAELPFGVEPGPELAKETVAGVDSQTLAALRDNPEMKITNEQGKEVMAREALIEQDNVIKKAKQDAPGYDAAIACALRG